MAVYDIFTLLKTGKQLTEIFKFRMNIINMLQNTLHIYRTQSQLNYTYIKIKMLNR